MTPARFDCDLLVVGLGPVGAALAGLATLHGLKVIAVERETDIHPLPRAAVFDDEVMRILQALGVAKTIEPLCRRSEKYQFLSAMRETLMEFDFRGVATTSGWAPAYNIHQPAVELALRERLAALAVDIRTGTTLIALRQDEGVEAEVKRDGETMTIRCRYLVGCDGASSRIRNLLGVALSDYGFDERWLVVDALVADASALPAYTLQICDPARPTTCTIMGPGRHRWEFMLKPHETDGEMQQPERISELLEPWACGEITLERAKVYHFHGMIAERWRTDRVFLAGDAAHMMPPFAGQGMCSGFRDAMNLAWKLAAAVNGDSEAILDTYQCEREPHVRAIIETAIAMGRLVCILDPKAAADRDSDMLARRAAGERPVSIRYPDLVQGLLLSGSPGAGSLCPQPWSNHSGFDDMLGVSEFCLLGRDLPILPAGGRIRALDLAGPLLKPFAEPLDAWLAGLGRPAAMIRPDRHVFGSGPARHLLGALEARLSSQPAFT